MACGNFGVVQDPLKFFENGRGDQELELFGAPGIKHLPGSTLRVEYPADKHISIQNRPYHRLLRRDFRVLLTASFTSRSIVSGVVVLILLAYAIDAAEELLTLLLPRFELGKRYDRCHWLTSSLNDVLVTPVIHLFKELTKIFPCFKRADRFAHVDNPFYIHMLYYHANYIISISETPSVSLRNYLHDNLLFL